MLRIDHIIGHEIDAALADRQHDLGHAGRIEFIVLEGDDMHRRRLHVATDWAPYADEILTTLAAEPLLVNGAQGFAPQPPWRPRTKFEARGEALGHEVFDLLFERR